MRQSQMPDTIAHRDFVETQLVKSLDAPEGVMFATETPEQTKIVMDAIIGNSRNDLRLMARSLNRAVNDPTQILRQIKKERDLFIQVIVEMADPFSCHHSALSELKTDPDVRERVTVKRLAAPSPVHLSIGDNVLARIQENDKLPATIVAFNNKDVVGRAANRFSYLWENRCVPLHWPTLETIRPAPG
jgi:hypothetical protein